MDQIEEPRNARSRRTRASLLDAARGLIETEGFAALTMAAVAERAGVTRRSVYLHFASRAELVTALFDHVNATEGLADSVGRVWDSPDARTALVEWAGHIARYHPRVAAIYRANDIVRGGDPDAELLWERILADWLAGCRRLARWLDREEQLSPAWTVRTATDMLFALMSFDMLERLTEQRSWTPQMLTRQYTQLLSGTFLR